ncbi:MAG: hypothetical protein ACM3WV_10960 [Bacillota bacterium]
MFNFKDDTSTVTPFATGLLEDIETTEHGPGGEPVAGVFKAASGCSGADSTVVQEAYKCRGMFLSINPYEGGGEQVLLFMLDPSGRYLGFTCFENHAAAGYVYRFGFGIKDPDYSNTGL